MQGNRSFSLEDGYTGNQRIAVAAYNDDSQEGSELVKCIKKDLTSMSTRLFVIKWKNQEIWLMQLLHQLQTRLMLY